jgi:hypothetical protein
MSLFDTPESADFYDCVNVDEVCDGEPAGTLAVLAFIQQQNEALTDRQLELIV